MCPCYNKTKKTKKQKTRVKQINFIIFFFFFEIFIFVFMSITDGQEIDLLIPENKENEKNEIINFRQLKKEQVPIALAQSSLYDFLFLVMQIINFFLIKKNGLTEDAYVYVSVIDKSNDSEQMGYEKFFLNIEDLFKFIVKLNTDERILIFENLKKIIQSIRRTIQPVKHKNKYFEKDNFLRSWEIVFKTILQNVNRQNDFMDNWHKCINSEMNRGGNKSTKTKKKPIHKMKIVQKFIKQKTFDSCKKPSPWATRSNKKKRII